MSPRELVSKICKKSVNPNKIISFGHAGALLKRYSVEIIEAALEKFPDEYKGLKPLFYLEGIIKELVLSTDISSVSQNNLQNAQKLQNILSSLFPDNKE